MIGRVGGEAGARGRHPDWERVYAESACEALPWHNPHLDPDVAAALARRELKKGPFWDIGCGAGTQTRALASLGFTVTGTDVSRSAIEHAASQAPSGAARFLVDDVLSPKLRERFLFALDLGCLHVLDPSVRPIYVRNVARLLMPGGLLFLKVFAVGEPDPGFGPHRFDAADLRTLFAQDFDVLSIQPSVYHGPRAHKPQALFAVLERKVEL